jgi:flavin reductase (DIM6/NTAB) family NADH-FMN oxidoreductase RutF
MHKSINYKNFSIDIFKAIGDDAFILASGTIENHNCMTVAWASLGFLWRRPMAFVYVRPQRYTYLFMEKYDYFSINFFTNDYSDVINLCGTYSGRDINKMKLEKITPIDYFNKVIYYKEAKTVLICKKVYYQDLDPANIIDKSVFKLYPLKDFHRIYYGEIIEILSNS